MSGTTRLAAWLGTWGRPVNRPALVALLLAGVLALMAISPARLLAALGVPTQLPRETEHRRRLVLTLAFVAAFLSLGYIAFYLRGGPRIIDATSYYLEARALSHGHLSWHVPSPSASFRGRFLLFHGTDSLSVIFPPGYPLLLAVGFILGAPLVIGPLLAGALVIATYWLARELADSERLPSEHALGVLAALFSVVCAALRYHTADTMSHAASALGITLALTLALRGARMGERWPWLVAGLFAGWVLCTRPVSSVPLLVALAFLAPRGRRARLAAGVLPGVLVLLFGSWAQTGRLFTSAQAAYYAVSDGPPGCFRYGFGAGVGCMLEHRDFVASRLPHGYGVVPALLTTLRRLRVHLLDVANLEPLALLVLVPLRRASRAVLATGMLVLLQVIAYVPFYFDGDYPGGGARFFADVLPLEHALLALAVVRLAPRWPLLRKSLAALALSIAGFAVHGAFEHEALAARDGGRRAYDPEVGREAGKGVLFLDKDDAFDLAYDPFADPARATLAARSRGDDHDRLLAERIGHPHAYRQGAKSDVVGTWTSPTGGNRDVWKFEAEADWPPLAQDAGWVDPIWASGSCASAGRALTLHPAGVDAKATATIAVPVPRTGTWHVAPRVVRRGGHGHGTLRLVPRARSSMPSDAALVWHWNDDEAGAKPGHDTCAELPSKEVPLGMDLDVPGAEWEITAEGGDVTLDSTTLRAR